jgi:hypothetical protein
MEVFRKSPTLLLFAQAELRVANAGSNLTKNHLKTTEEGG